MCTVYMYNMLIILCIIVTLGNYYSAGFYTEACDLHVLVINWIEINLGLESTFFLFFFASSFKKSTTNSG